MPLIYIVEDDENIREIQRYALKNSGFDVQEFSCGKELCRALEETLPSLGGEGSSQREAESYRIRKRKSERNRVCRPAKRLLDVFKK